MSSYFPAATEEGYVEIIADQSRLELIRFSLLRLHKGEQVCRDSGDYEIGLVILGGTCTVECAEQTFAGLGARRDVFSGRPSACYIPLQSRYTVIATGEGICEAALCQVKAARKYAPFAIRPEEVSLAHRGQLNWQRDVCDIITSRYDGRVDRIVLGETYGAPGQWSSYPSHKHDRDNPPDEVSMEEVYHFKVNPARGFGIQVLYNDDFTLNESYIIRNGDTVAIKEGYHPVAAAPGYQIYYLWVMAGQAGRTLIPRDDPQHAWVKAVEAMVR